MAEFNYRALDGAGRRVKGDIDAPSRDAAMRALERRSLDVFEIRERPPQFSLSRQKRLSPKDHARFMRQLATLLGAGVDLPDALASISRSRTHPDMAQGAGRLLTELRAGEPLSTGMTKHMPSLPDYVPRLAELGEQTGQLADSLTDAAERMEFEDELRAEIRTAFAYPTFLAVVGLLLVILLFIFVVPRFADMIGDNRDNVPAVSRVVIDLGTWMSQNVVLFLGSAAAIIALIIYTVRSETARRTVVELAERMPGLGAALKRARLGNWAATVGVAIKNGADLMLALRLGEGAVGVGKLQSALRSVRRRVRSGAPLEDVLAEEVPDFDPLAIDMLRTGRASGRLSEMLLFVSGLEREETRRRSQRLSAVAEPVAILLISVVVGTVVISIVLAMTSVYDFAV